MPRYAKADQTIEDLKELIEESIDPDYGEDSGVYGILNGEGSTAQDRVLGDLSKIEVSFENVESFDSEESYSHLPGLECLDGYEMLGSGDSSFPVLWCAGGGDWEYPIVFVLYMGQKGELRAYIPKDGNAYNHKEKSAYGNNDGDPDFNDDEDNPDLEFDVDKMRADVANRIVVAGSAVPMNRTCDSKTSITFRQLVQSLRDFDDQYAAIMPQAKDAEHPVWGIQYIWFADGILMLGQHDDEGLDVGLIIEKIEKCLPQELLDTPATVKIGVAEDVDSDSRKILDKYGEDAKTNTVSSSVVKHIRNDDCFCKWVLKFV